jgi:AraC family transcriptional regulator, ethanolamine operon transcriptional activator
MMELPMPATVIERLTSTLAPFAKRITDFEDALRFLSHWQGRIEQLSCGRFEGTIHAASGRHIQAQLASGNQALSIRGRDGPGLCAFSLVLPESSRCIWQNHRLDPGCLFVRGGGVEVDHRTSRSVVNLTFMVAEETLRSTVRTLNRKDPGPIDLNVTKPPPELYSRLEERLVQFMVAASVSAPRNGQDAHQLEQACIAAAVAAAFPEADSHAYDLPFSARADLVRRAVELMRARIRIQTGEIDLCTALEVPGRTLRLAFREQFGLGPIAYFQTLRLNAVRDALKVADPLQVSVADIAEQFGFGHLGKFAGYYRRLFGELPSQTLARNSGCQGVNLPRWRR